jgi:Fe2+ transport system protein FeoA
MWYDAHSVFSAAPTADRPHLAGTVPLADLAPGATAVLRHIGDPQARDVLRSLGLVTGAHLRLCRVGDPCIIQVRSTRIGLSHAVAQEVFVAVDGAAR